jgi:hypothetical protein
MVLRITVEPPSTHIDIKARTLAVCGRNAEQEIRRWIAGAISGRRIEEKVAAIICKKRASHDDPLDAGSEFQIVISGNLAEVIKVVIVLVYSRLRTTESKCELTIHVH